MRVRGRFYLAFAVQMGLLMFVVLAKQHAPRVGRVLVLASEPRDANRPFDGDQLVLEYPISRLPSPPFEPLIGDHVYVSPPETSDGAAVVRPFNPRDGRIWLRGEVTARTSTTIDVDYGIERYRLHGPLVRAIDRRADPLAVELRVDGAGQAAIRQILVDGRPIDAS